MESANNQNGSRDTHCLNEVQLRREGKLHKIYVFKVVAKIRLLEATPVRASFLEQFFQLLKKLNEFVSIVKAVYIEAENVSYYHKGYYDQLKDKVVDKVEILNSPLIGNTQFIVE